jgi:hypothetical protein
MTDKLSLLLLFVNIYKLAKMIVEKTILVFVALVALARAGDDQLLRMGERHSCIKQVITVFVANKNCNTLDDAAKSHVHLSL